MDFEALGARFSWILVTLDAVFWFLRPLSRDMRGACQVADLTLMIRATRGRSRRPNHMRSTLDALQTPIPVDLRRLPRDFHSVAKPDAFKTPFVRVPGRFWRFLGRFWEVQKEVKIYFWETFCDASAERVVESIFWLFFNIRILVFLRTASVL